VYIMPILLWIVFPSLFGRHVWIRSYPLPSRGIRQKNSAADQFEHLVCHQLVCAWRGSVSANPISDVLNARNCNLATRRIRARIRSPRVSLPAISASGAEAAASFLNDGSRPDAPMKSAPRCRFA
jgi:hypothetical protein